MDTGPIERKEMFIVMSRLKRTCPNPDCGKKSYTKGDFCQYCGGEMTPIDQEENLVNEIEETKEGGNGMSNLKKLGLVVLALLIAWLIWANYNDQQSADNKKTVNDIVATENDSTTITVATIHVGLDQPSKSWFVAKAGTAISGDICIYDGDNNSRKIPIYDSAENTADILYLNSDTYVWTEWGCYTIENADAQDITTLINDKLTNGNFKTVRYFNGYSKLGTNTPTIINSKIDAANITLPIASTK
ncbi:MAG: hypothetical protein PHN66_03825 [Candidatus Shapirobacteria bacterium]|nr:hypothetical protein [Candidatus Shapirobacteria bacterium]